MKTLILNSGLGSRMGMITNEHPKCMTEISHKNSILSRQLRMLVSFGVEDVIMTTGYYDKVLVDYCNALHLPLKYTVVNNPLNDKTNYIYSIYCAKDALNNTPVVQTNHNLLPLPVASEAPSLSSVNNGVKNMNDFQIQWMRGGGCKQ